MHNAELSGPTPLKLNFQHAAFVGAAGVTGYENIFQTRVVEQRDVGIHRGGYSLLRAYKME